MASQADTESVSTPRKISEIWPVSKIWPVLGASSSSSLKTNIMAGTVISSPKVLSSAMVKLSSALIVL